MLEICGNNIVRRIDCDLTDDELAKMMLLGYSCDNCIYKMVLPNQPGESLIKQKYITSFEKRNKKPCRFYEAKKRGGDKV